MAKRNTTGLPKKRRSREETETTEAGSGDSLVQQLQSNVRQPDQLQRLIVVGTSILVGALLLLIVGALSWQYLIVPGQQVASVNGEPITVAQFQERVRLERAILTQRLNLDLGLLIELGQDPNQLINQEPYATWWGEIGPNGQPELLGIRVLNDMIEERILRAEAEARGITVDEAAVEEQVEQFFNFNRPDEDADAAEVEPTATDIPTETPTPFVSPTPSSTPRPTNTPEPTPTPLDEAATEDEADEGPTAVPSSTPRPTNTPEPTRTFEEREERFNSRLETFYTNTSRRANLGRETVRQYFEYEALRAALQDEIVSEIDSETTYVNARHILVNTQAEAESILQALQDGESFAALARAASIDEGSGAQGGDLGWTAATNYVPEFRDAVLDAPIAEVIGPVESQFGFHIIEVRAREEREMTDQELDRARLQTFEEWLEETTSDENNDITRGENWPQHVPLEPQFIYEPVGENTPTPLP